VISQKPGPDGVTGQRRTRRAAAAALRQARVLELIVAGWSNGHIAAELGVAPSTVTRDVETVLARRAEESNPALQQVRELQLERILTLWKAWIPLALGEYEVENPVTGDRSTPPPDPRAAEIAIKLWDRIGLIGAAIEPPAQNTTNVLIINSPEDRNTAQAKILQSLADVAAKRNAIDGDLADAGTSYDERTGHATPDDKPAPPPHIQETA
jgi:DNA-binding CsgD family transcriptional regulator